MSKVSSDQCNDSRNEQRTDERELLRLNLDVWHPNCWTLQVTEQEDGGMLGHGSHTTTGGQVKGRFTLYADSIEDIDSLLEAIRKSPLTKTVLELHDGFAQTSTNTLGNTTREIFVEYRPENSIDSEFAFRGFILEEPVRISNGTESWSVTIHASRDEMQDKLDAVRDAMDAEISVLQITTHKENGSRSSTQTLLSERQREVFEFARKRDYYTWPRQVSAQELAVEMDISKTTFLEHLRKAEVKLLNQ